MNEIKKKRIENRIYRRRSSSSSSPENKSDTHKNVQSSRNKPLYVIPGKKLEFNERNRAETIYRSLAEDKSREEKTEKKSNIKKLDKYAKDSAFKNTKYSHEEEKSIKKQKNDKSQSRCRSRSRSPRRDFIQGHSIRKKSTDAGHKYVKQIIREDRNSCKKKRRHRLKSTDTESEEESLCQKKLKHKKRKKHRRRSTSRESDSSLSNSEEDIGKKYSKADKKAYKEKKKKKKHKKKLKKDKIFEKKDVTHEMSKNEDCDLIGPDPDKLKAKAMAPMTKDEWEKQQSTIKRVFDIESGRHRLIKGDGEVIEEIVSYKRQKEINKMATQSDGAYFQAKLGLNK